MKTYKQIAFLLILILSCLNAQSQDKKKTVSEDQSRLQKFAGKWVADLTMTDANNKVSKVQSTVTFSPVAEGDGLYGTETAEDPQMGKFSASYLIGYDPYEKKIHFFAVDNMGTCHDHDCTWKSPDNFYVEHNSEKDGKAYKEVVNCVFKDQNTMDFSATMSLDGKTVESVKGTYKKVSR